MTPIQENEKLATMNSTWPCPKDLFNSSNHHRPLQAIWPFSCDLSSTVSGATDVPTTKFCIKMWKVTTVRYQPPGQWRHPKFMASDNNEKVPRAGKLTPGSYSANFEWKSLNQFHQQHFFSWTLQQQPDGWFKTFVNSQSYYNRYIV